MCWKKTLSHRPHKHTHHIIIFLPSVKVHSNAGSTSRVIIQNSFMMEQGVGAQGIRGLE